MCLLGSDIFIYQDSTFFTTSKCLLIENPHSLLIFLFASLALKGLIVVINSLRSESFRICDHLLSEFVIKRNCFDSFKLVIML